MAPCTIIILIIVLQASFFFVAVSKRNYLLNIRNDTTMAIIASHEHGSPAIFVRLGDVFGRAHLEQPLADQQVATLASPVHGSPAIFVRLGDVFCFRNSDGPLIPPEWSPALVLESSFSMILCPVQVSSSKCASSGR